MPGRLVMILMAAVGVAGFLEQRLRLSGS
jgi:hypothetical protein